MSIGKTRLAKYKVIVNNFYTKCEFIVIISLVDRFFATCFIAGKFLGFYQGYLFIH